VGSDAYRPYSGAGPRVFHEDMLGSILDICWLRQYLTFVVGVRDLIDGVRDDVLLAAARRLTCFRRSMT
jgi:hypothetical protein